MTSSQPFYEGKAKRLYKVSGNEQEVILEFKDDLTAFNALKKGSFAEKGKVNRDIASLIFRYLKKHGVESHWLEDLEPVRMRALKVEIIPLEVVVRNILAGSTAKKLGIAEGQVLDKALVEFYYKDDALGDPFLSDDQALMLKAAQNQKELDTLKTLALKINQALKDLFLKIDIKLVDFKIEFGKLPSGQILLADEITPDSCRLWDIKTNEKLDKDRFRRDLGGIKEAYLQVFERLKEVLAKEKI